MYPVRFSPCVSRFSVDKRAMQEGYCIPTGKKTPGGAGTHTGHVRDTRAHKDTDHTDEPHILTPVNKAQSVVRMKLASEHEFAS